MLLYVFSIYKNFDPWLCVNLFFPQIPFYISTCDWWRMVRLDFIIRESNIELCSFKKRLFGYSKQNCNEYLCQIRHQNENEYFCSQTVFIIVQGKCCKKFIFNKNRHIHFITLFHFSSFLFFWESEWRTGFMEIIQYKRLVVELSTIHSI